MGQTKIEWTSYRRPDGSIVPGYTFNPVRGCQKISPGCANCYAEKMSHRNPSVLGEWGPDGRRAVAAESYWKLPYAWNRKAERAGERRRVFCASLADWLEDRPEWDASRLRLLATVRATWHLDWLLLTKRPENWQKLILRAARQAGDASDTGDAGLSEWLMGWLYGDKPHNIWTGASVEDQARCDGRIPRLRAIPAVVHFLSAEPLLESVKLDLYGIDWVIVGGESGSNARPVHPDWVSEIRDQCQTAKVPFYFKQWGEWKPICEMSEEENRSLYKSNVKAEDKYDQDKLDDIYGRTCRVENSAIGYGGTLGYEKAFYLVNGHGGMQIFKVGKEKAGRTLNGVEYNEAPNLCS